MVGVGAGADKRKKDDFRSAESMIMERDKSDLLSREACKSAGCRQNT